MYTADKETKSKENIESPTGNVGGTSSPSDGVKTGQTFTSTDPLLRESTSGSMTGDHATGAGQVRDESSLGAQGLPSGIENVDGYVPNQLSELSLGNNTETGEEAEEIEAAIDEAVIDAYFANEDETQEEFFGAILSALAPTIVKGAGKLAGNLIGRLRRRRHTRRINPRLLRRRETDFEATLDDADFVEVVIGDDDRQEVTVTHLAPWNGICHLSILASNNRRYLGTGWLIGPRTVITAGHCVYLHDAGGYASSILVTPGLRNSNRPFGSIKSTEFKSVQGWTKHRNRNYDYGCIILPSAPKSNNGEQPFNFSYSADSDDAITSATLNLAGYPGDKGGRTMWFMARKPKSVSKSVVTYDTDTAGGQSGSPTWSLANNQRISAGIHTNGSYLGNSATRITPDVKNIFDSWKAASGK